MDLFSGIISLTIAWAVEMIAGYPRALSARFGHPALWMEKLVDWLDRRLNFSGDDARTRRSAGIVAAVVLVLVAGMCGYLIERALLVVPYGFLLLGLVASTMLASHAMPLAVNVVMRCLEQGRFDECRCFLSTIDNRVLENADQGNICRTTIENLARSFSDDVIAPIFWYALFGLPGMLICRIINVADRMIGHRTPRYEVFGWACACLDDWLNLVPARLAALLLVVAARTGRAMSAVRGWRVMRRDAGNHCSPNLGWPQAVMAGALGLKFPAHSGSGRSIGDGRAEITPEDMQHALDLFHRACLILSCCVGLLALWQISLQYR